MFDIPSLTFAAVLLSCVLTCLGWFVTHKQTKSRELRKENRAIVDDLNTTLDRLLDASHGYYCSTNIELQEKSTLEIHVHINRLSGIIEILEKKDPKLRLNQKFVSLYEAITGGDFESANVKRGDISSEKYKRFIVLSDTVRAECENWFQRYH